MSTAANPGPLAGIRVIDLTSVIMGPYATQFLGDFGADVIKIEAPAGDLVRAIGPERHSGMGPMFLNSNRSKRSLVVDLKTPEGRALVLRLCTDADVLVYNVRPAAMARLGLSYEAVRAVNPRLIYAGLYGFGQAGPYAARPAYDDLIQGGTGVAHMFRLSGEGAPRYIPSAVADRAVGLIGVSGILAALFARSRSGEGQAVEIPMFESMAGFFMADHLGGLTFDPPLDGGGYPRQLAPNRRPVATADGYICALVYTDDHWRRFGEAIGEAAQIAHPHFATYVARSRHVEEVNAWFEARLRSRSSAEWLALFEQIDVPAMRMHDFESLLSDPHLEAVGFFNRIEHPSEGPILSMANPVRLSATPVTPPRLAPRFGEHSREVLREAGLTDLEIAALEARKVIAQGA